MPRILKLPDLLDLLKAPPARRSRKQELAFLLIPLVLWVGLLLLRPVLIHPSCDPALHSRNLCTSENVPAFDRVALGLNSAQADAYSYFTQNLSGALAASGPLVFNGVVAFSSALGPQAALGAALSSTLLDWVILGETWIWNGAAGEITRDITQRPRPFVYADPKAAGPNPAHYVSFYSGHTSFAAASLMALLLILLSRRAPVWSLLVSAGVYEALTFSTGIYRILAGRHFPSDVIVGALAGSLIALIVAILHRRPT